MNEKELFNIVDNISDEDLSMIMNKEYTKDYIENSNDNNNEKEKIRAKLHGKIVQATELDLKREAKKGKGVKKNKIINKIVKSVIAAMLVFVVSVNVFPGVALALVKIPGLDKLIKIVSYDKGFNNVINNGNIQEVGTAIEDKGVKFTVTEVAGDDLKLWIGYEIESEDLIEDESLMLGKIIKFKNKADGKYLPWSVIGQDKDYMEVHMDRVVKDFEIEIAVYKDNPSFHIARSELDEKAISDIEQLYENSKITTLNIPISLNDKIYNKGLRVFNIKGKEFKSEVGIFKIAKLELSGSRSRVYCELLSEENKLTGVLEPSLVDGEGTQYFSPSDFTSYVDDNMIYLELQGGIDSTKDSTKGLTFQCGGFKYINKQDKHITIDLKNKQVDPNNLGISIIDVDGSNITLNVSENAIEFSLEAKNEKGKKVAIKEIEVDSFKETVKFKFNELKDEKIILDVKSIQYNVPLDFEMRLID
ncbi:DUF4179 domain-containing protein [Clostridium sp.]|uniref:DUF4179 domain-containing protein n=1 Tax=Clostridium sp. TaxID=1506 RepID=UPI001A4CEE4C|nr:DUF4179 domain-containing protein [Clostridium sp.]MBK5242493.1 DUF4179 domain-containing protein [Clostridium sp.]